MKIEDINLQPTIKRVIANRLDVNLELVNTDDIHLGKIPCSKNGYAHPQCDFV